MKIKPHTGITRVALCASMIFALTACSHAPSDSEAKAVIKDRFADCKYISLDSFEKVNGIPVDDNDYRVDVKYTVSLTPEDSDLQDGLKEWAKRMDQIASLKEQFNESMKEGSGDLNAYIAAHPDDPDASTHFNDQDPGFQKRTALLAQIQDIQNQSSGESPARTFMRRVSSECSKVDPSIVSQLFGKSTADSIADKATMDFSETIAMIKTDDGWQAAR